MRTMGLLANNSDKCDENDDVDGVATHERASVCASVCVRYITICAVHIQVFCGCTLGA